MNKKCRPCQAYHAKQLKKLRDQVKRESLRADRTFKGWTASRDLIGELAAKNDELRRTIRGYRILVIAVTFLTIFGTIWKNM